MIAAGYEEDGVALKADGTVVVWGYNGDGQQNVPAVLTNVVAITAGSSIFALKSDGTVTGWGFNGYGDLNIPAGLSNVVAISAGNHHTLALKANGTVVAWGYNGYGQCEVPQGLNNVVSIAAGDSASYALKTDGTIVGWGINDQGQINIPAGLANVTSISAGAHVLALLDNPAPAIKIPPVSHIASLGQAVPFYAVGSGFPPLRYQWYRNGTVIAGATTSALVIPNTQSTNAGSYSVIVSNSLGSATSTPATLTVLTPPQIVSQPRSQVGYWGLGASFHFSAVGTPPFSYQWYFDGFPITWATNATLDLLNLDLNAGGQYWVKVTNPYGSATSDSASLMVNPASVSPGLYFGLTITGAVGKTFGIQYVTNVNLTSSWITITNLTLTQPEQLWIDPTVNISDASQARRLYRAVAIP